VSAAAVALTAFFRREEGAAAEIGGLLLAKFILRALKG
jgi:hypothetical protein